MIIRTAAAIASAAILHGAAPADILLTTDGRFIKDRPMERNEDHVLIQFENGEVKVPNELVEEVILDSDVDNLPRARQSWLKRKIKERAEALEEGMEHGEWRDRYIEKSKYFDWMYTITKPIGEGIQLRFDEYYDYFKKRWKLKPDKRKGRMTVNFYRNSKQYQRVTGSPPGALAYFRFVPPYDLNACYDRLDPIETEMVLYHELSHYVQKLIDEDFKMPHWPGEGISEYFGGVLWNEEEKDFDWNLLQEGRLAEVQQDMLVGKYISLRDMIVKADYTDYTWGWAFIYFLYQDKARGERFEKYMLGLSRDRGVKRVPFAFGLVTVTGEESLRYFMECMKLKDQDDLEDLQEEFYEYLKEDLSATTNSGLEKAAIKALQVGRRLRAKRLFGEAEEAGGLSSVGSHRYAQLIKNEDRKKALTLYEKAIAADPLEATYWWWRGDLLERDDEEEGARMQALAQELDPEIGDSIVDFTFQVESEIEDE